MCFSFIQQVVLLLLSLTKGNYCRRKQRQQLFSNPSGDAQGKCSVLEPERAFLRGRRLQTFHILSVVDYFTIVVLLSAKYFWFLHNWKRNGFIRIPGSSPRWSPGFENPYLPEKSRVLRRGQQHVGEMTFLLGRWLLTLCTLWGFSNQA